MRKYTAALAFALGLALAPADAVAASSPVVSHVATVKAGTSSSLHQGQASTPYVASGATLHQGEKAQEPSKRKYRTKRRSGISRFFGFLGFLMCLPLLIVLVIALMLMSRRGARRRQEQMMNQQSSQVRDNTGDTNRR